MDSVQPKQQWQRTERLQKCYLIVRDYKGILSTNAECNDHQEVRLRRRMFVPARFSKIWKLTLLEERLIRFGKLSFGKLSMGMFKRSVLV